MLFSHIKKGDRIMFDDMNFRDDIMVSNQIEAYIKNIILKGMLRKGEKLPSTRELAAIMNVSRNSVIKAYQGLNEDGFIYSINNKGVFVQDVHVESKEDWSIDWSTRISGYTKIAEELDIIKSTIKTEKEVISFRGVSPDRELFDIEGFKRGFLNIISMEGPNILNYGYARGYRPLVDYLMQYMRDKGVDTTGKDILITNGFTEGFDILLSVITEEGDKIVCENPTHNTAIKIMKLHGLEIIGVDMDIDGMNIDKLREKLSLDGIKAGYLVPSYHNPTGIVMTPEKRLKAYELFKEHNIPVIEDGFNEELRYSGAHISPIAAFSGGGNGVVYIGSFSKVLFPGMRIGWVLADSSLVSSLESVKKSRNIHTSFLDQAILYQYLHEGNFEKYIKKSRRVYGERYSFALECAHRFIPCRRVSGDGGMYIFVELQEDIDAEELLLRCYEKGVIFMAGSIFYIDGRGRNTMRLGFAKVHKPEIEKGFQIIGETVGEMSGIIGEGRCTY